MGGASEFGDFTWRVLRLLNLFRLALSAILLPIFFLVTEPRIIGASNPALALAALLAMLGFGLLGLLLLQRRYPIHQIQTYLYFVVDLTSITTLLHASGGISSGLGGLLIVSVGGLGLLFQTDRAFFLAALTTLVVLLEQSLAQLQGMTSSAQFAPAGILGAIIFVVAAVIQVLRRQIVATEALAAQRGVDLKNLVELNEYIIQHLRESIVVVDGQDRIRLINPSATGHLGADATAAGSKLSDISSDLARDLSVWRDSGSSPAGTRKSSSSTEVATGIKPHFAALGSAPSDGIVIFLEDTSLIAERVQQAKLAALGRLSASIAHEIRNPLGAMSHAGQLLAESLSIGDDDHRLTDIIRVNSRRVSQIVDSVLALSRPDTTQAEQLQLKAWAEDFADEFTKTQELYEGTIAVKNTAEDLEIDMDPTHLHQILWNLCDNAVKYASAAAGAIAVEIDCGYLETSGRPYLEIGDSGQGIEPDKVEQIFEPFFTGQPGGTGLGLYISRELCERNGATLRYHPRAGGGSLFRIVFADPNRWQLSEEM